MASITPTGRVPLLPGTLKNLFYPPERSEYTYFARAAAHPFAGASAVVKAAWAADASMLCYARYGLQPMPEADFTGHLARAGLDTVLKIGDWGAAGTQGYFASNDRFAILAFRGTEADDPTDLADDTDILPVHEPDYRPVKDDPQPALLHLSLIEHLFSPPCLVHQGFQRALNRVWGQVHDCVIAYRKTYPQAEVCITGHSLGGALAVLAFSRFADSNLSLFAIGCPRVGNQAFGDHVTADASRTIFRCVNFNDAVAHIPLESAAYRHSPLEYHHFDQDGNLTTEIDDGRFLGDVQALETAFHGLPQDLRTGLDQIPAPPSVVDHSPARYCIRLWNCI
jgi:hypothetical protein